MVRRSRIDWGEVGNLICAILTKLREERLFFEEEAARRGITLEQLAAATIAEAIRQRVEASAFPK